MASDRASFITGADLLVDSGWVAHRTAPKTASAEKQFPLSFISTRAVEHMRDAGLDAMLFASPENVFYTTGYTALPSSGNPILYTLRIVFPSSASSTEMAK